MMRACQVGEKAVDHIWVVVSNIFLFLPLPGEMIQFD